MDLLDPGLNGRRVTSIVLMLMIWILAVSTLILTLGSQAEIAAAEALYPDCQTSEKPIMTGKLNPGENIEYFGEMKVVTGRMNTGQECR